MLDTVLTLLEKNLKPSVAADGKHLVDESSYYDKTKQLIDLLENAGVIHFDSKTNLYDYIPFIEGNKQNRPERMVSQMLGYTVEGIVVRECNSDLSKNAKWANIARLLRIDKNWASDLIMSIRWHPFSQNPDNYYAIGTGLVITSTKNPSWYNRQSDRDICWIDNETRAEELLVPTSIIKDKHKTAGIQLKVSSCTNGSYLTHYFRMKRAYNLYPVVYFDLGNDFYKVRENLLNLSSNRVKENSLFSNQIEFLGGLSKCDIIDIMLHRGRDIDASIHDELLYYKSVFEQLASNKISLLDLTNDKIILALVFDYLRQNIVQTSPILTVPYGRKLYHKTVNQGIQLSLFDI